MGDPITAIALGSMVAGTALKATGDQMAGQERSRAAAYEQQQMEANAQLTRTAALEDEARRRDDLNSSIGTILAIQAGRGVGLNSPTTKAIIGDVQERGEDAIHTSKLNLLSKADAYKTGAEMAGKKAKYSLIAGDLATGADIFSGIGSAARLGMRTGGTGLGTV